LSLNKKTKKEMKKKTSAGWKNPNGGVGRTPHAAQPDLSWKFKKMNDTAALAGRVSEEGM